MLKIIAAAAIFVFTVFTIVSFSPIFKVTQVEIHQAQMCLPQNTKEVLSLSGKNLFELNTNSLAQNIRAQYTCAESVNVSKKIPGTVVLDIQTKKLVVAVDGADLILTADGDVITSQNAEKLPKIFLPQNISVQAGQKINDPQVLFALTVTSLVTKTDFSPQSVRIIDKPDVALYDANGTVVLFSQNSSAENQVDSLQSVLAKAKIDATKIAKIDLRFQKPVVELKAK